MSRFISDWLRSVTTDGLTEMLSAINSELARRAQEVTPIVRDDGISRGDFLEKMKNTPREGLLTPEEQRLLDSGKLIPVVKLVKTRTGLSLHQAKIVLDRAQGLL